MLLLIVQTQQIQKRLRLGKAAKMLKHSGTLLESLRHR